MKKTSFTYELDEDQQEKLLDVIMGDSYTPRSVPYSVCAVEGDHFNATLYAKEKHGRRKLCVQGSGAEDFVLYTLEPHVLGGASLGYERELDPEAFAPHAGSDESGKGDYFGPLVVCCAYADGDLAAQMAEMGVKDCKQMSDAAVLDAGARLRELLGADGYALVKFGPAAYNRLYAKMRNVNRMLAWAHGVAIEELLTKRPGCARVVVDQFAPTEDTILRALKEKGRAAKVEQRHRAESDIAVAAASVLAREAFLRDMARLGEAAGTGGSLPLGSSDPRVAGLAREMVGRCGANWIMNFAKAHFQTTDKVLAACGLSRDTLPPEGRVTSAVRARPPASA